MSKSVLVIDTPKQCINCKIGQNKSNCMETCIYCPIAEKTALDDETETIPGWCPLSPLPERMIPALGGDNWMQGYAKGWNACINEITGGEVYD